MSLNSAIRSFIATCVGPEQGGFSLIQPFRYFHHGRALARFELQGPTCNSLLHRVIFPSSEAYKSLQIRALARCLSCGKDSVASDSYQELQHEAWINMRRLGSDCVPMGHALALSCLDPRLVKSLRSAKDDENIEREDIFLKKPWLSQSRDVGRARGERRGEIGGRDRLCQGAFWDFARSLCRFALVTFDLRSRQLSRRPLSDSSLNSCRQNGLLTFKSAASGTQEHGLDTTVLLLRRSETSSRSFTPSTQKWTLVVPRSWTRVFWNSLILNGAKAVGVMDLKVRNFADVEKLITVINKEINLQHASPTFPFDFPDSFMYKEWTEQVAEEISARCFPLLEVLSHTDPSSRMKVLPPSVRVNHKKLGTRHPVVTLESWRGLFGSNDGDLEVIREKSSWESLCESSARDLDGKGRHLLVAVVLQSERRGVPCKDAMITVVDRYLQTRLREISKTGGEPSRVTKITSSDLKLELPQEAEATTMPESVGGFVTSGCHSSLTGRGFAIGMLKAEDVKRVLQADSSNVSPGGGAGNVSIWCRDLRVVIVWQEFLVVVRNNHSRNAFLCEATLIFQR
eukprot:753201-Hanusia_phi.AAC.3